MRTRHRVPTIFNLSMVDVLCCALGCVILLWLLNQRDARDQAGAAEQTGQQLDQNQLSLDSAERELRAVRQSLAASQQQERQLAAQGQQADQAARVADAAREQWFRAVANSQLIERDANRRLAALQTTGQKMADLLGEKRQLETLLARRNDELVEAADQATGLRVQTKL